MARKRQHFFYNDAAVAKDESATYVEMHFDASTYRNGVPRPMLLTGDFVGIGALRFDTTFAANTKLWHAGITNQSGHSEDRLVLLFYRDRACATPTATLSIDGTDVPLALDLGERLAYSQGIAIGIIPFGTFTNTSRSVERDARGIVAYVHETFGSTFRCEYDVPLDPNVAGETTYHISLGSYRDITSGRVYLKPSAREVFMRYEPLVPHWARAYAFDVHFDRSSGSLMVARAGHTIS